MERPMFKNTTGDEQKIHIKYNIEKKIIWTASLTVIALSFYICFLLYQANRSLWIDEAMLAYSLETRGFADLIGTALALDQSAPVLFLYIVKSFTAVLGSSEFSLRLFSLISYAGTLAFSFLLFRKAFRVKYPVIGVAIISVIKILLYYSNELKPYMTDCMVVLLVVFLYYLYTEKKLNIWLLSIIYAALLWMSNPACFFICGVLAYEFILGILHKDKPLALKTMLGSLIVITSFLVYYFFWLKPVADSQYMIDFWSGYRFPLIPSGPDDIIKMGLLWRNIFNQMTPEIFTAAILAGGGVVFSFIKKNRFGIVIALGLLLSLIASCLGKYPFSPRLMLFAYPLIAILAFIPLDHLLKASRHGLQRLLAFLLIIALFLGSFSMTASSYLSDESSRYIAGEEANGLIQYIDDHIKNDEYVYVYFSSIPVFNFKNGYDTLHIGKNADANMNNVLLGKGFFLDGENAEDIEAVLSKNKCYVLISHIQDEGRIAPLLNALTEDGYLELADVSHSTNLYYHAKTLAGVKTNVEYKLESYIEKEGKGILRIKINNTGNVYLNPQSMDDVHLMCRENPNIDFVLDQTDIAPGQETEVNCTFEIPDHCREMNIQLVNKGKYWFDEIGIQPIKIAREPD